MDRSVAYLEGELYYRLTFPDSGWLYPLVETFVFIGKNLSDKDTEDTWYFQFADSYAEDGSILTATTGNRKVTLARTRDSPEMLDLAGLVQELEMATKRRRDKRKG